MGKLIKIVVYGLLGLVTLVLIAAAAVLILVDPNDYKGEIATAVEQQTGRKLSIGGDIGLTLFPWVAFEIGDVTLSNAPGFGEHPFAQVGKIDVRVKLLPLLKQQVEMDTVVLHGLELALARRADGTTNWDDLAKPATSGDGNAQAGDKPQTPGSDSPAAPAIALAVSGVDLRGASMAWDDQLAGASYRVDNLELTTGAIVLGQPVDIETGGDFAIGQPAMSGNFRLKGRVDLNQETLKIGVNGLELTVAVKGEVLPAGEAALRLAADIALDGKSGGVDLTALDLNLAGLPLRGELHFDGNAFNGKLESGEFDPQPLLKTAGDPLPDAKIDKASLAIDFNGAVAPPGRAEVVSFSYQFGELKGKANLKLADFAKPALSGGFEAGFVNPKTLLASLGIEAPATSDPQAMTKAGVRTTFEGGLTAMRLPKFELLLDDTYLHGEVDLRDFNKPDLFFRLQANPLNVDRYLPPPAAPADSGSQPETAPAPVAAAGGGDQPAILIPLPVELLRSLALDGELSLEQLKVSGLTIDGIKLVLQADGGLVRLEPATASLYQGDFHGVVRVDVRQDTPKFHIEKRLTNIESGPLLNDLTGKPTLSGRGTVTATIDTAGVSEKVLISSLNGKVGFDFRNGALEGINIGRMLREARAAIKGEAAPAPEPNRTDFAELGGSFNIRNGVADNRDLRAKTPLLRIEGEGKADLNQRSLDYLVRAAVVATSKGQGGKDLDDLRGIVVPLRATGPFDKLDYSLDLSEALRGKAKEELKQKAQKKIEEKLGDKLQGPLGDALKGLFR